jgi:polyribonucleotide nucleotidyltransferase
VAVCGVTGVVLMRFGLSAEVGIFPGLHGSGVFSRGNTQVLTTLTHGTRDDAIRLDDTAAEAPIPGHPAIFQYQFPMYAIGSVSHRGGGPDRREIGHAALMARALRPVLPAPEGDIFPGDGAYRIFAEVII